MQAATTPNEEQQSNQKPPRDPEARMTFIAHLAELRSRLIRSVVAALVGFAVCYAFSDQIIHQIAYPLRPLEESGQPVEEGELDPGQSVVEYGGIDWIQLHPLEGFLVKLKVAAYGGLFLAFPYILYQCCAFIFPGLTVSEKRMVKFLLIGCMTLGLAGAGLAYWGIFPFVLPYVADFAPDFVKIQLRLNDTLLLILKGLAAFGIAFQLPMVVMALVYVGLLTPAALKAYRKPAIVGIFVAAAIFTPPDPISLLLLGLPLIGLYELSIWLSYFVVRRKAKSAAAGNR